MIHRLLEGDVGDHVAAALPGRHLRRARLLAVDHADAGRAEHLMAGEDEEVAADRLHVDGHVRHGLRAVDQHAGAMPMRQRDHFVHRRHGAERVGNLGDGDDARRRAEQLLIFLQNDLAGVVDRRDAQLRAVSAQSCCQGTILA